MGILNTLETMLNAMERSREVQYERNSTSWNHAHFCSSLRNWNFSCLNCLQIVHQLEQVVISLIAKVLELSVMGRILHCESMNARWSFWCWMFCNLLAIIIAHGSFKLLFSTYMYVCLLFRVLWRHFVYHLYMHMLWDFTIHVVCLLHAVRGFPEGCLWLFCR